MRLIVFFDLPTETRSNRREYSRFRKFLIKNGFLMIQESVYCKLLLNQSHADTVIRSVKDNRPSDGLVHLLLITEKQFSKMEIIVGQFKTDIVNTDERYIEI